MGRYGYLDKKKNGMEERTASFEREERQAKRSRLRLGLLWRDWLLYLDNRIVVDERVIGAGFGCFR